MWNYNEKDLELEVGGGLHLSKSGCYHAIIKDISDVDTKGGARQVIFKLDVEGAETTVYHVYTKTTGEEIDFKVRHLNHLLFLNKLKDPSKLLSVKGKEIGVFLKAKLSQDKKFINFDIEGFFHTTTKKTAKELKDNLSAQVYENLKKKYDEETPLERVYEKSVQQQVEENKSNSDINFEDDDSFPF